MRHEQGQKRETPAHETGAREAGASEGRKPYKRPVLKVLGSVRELTLGGNTLNAFDGGGPAMKISTASMKEHISYISDEQRDRLAEEVRRLRFATYNYLGDHLPRLGFIVEDAPDAPFVHMSEKKVDLYAFASAIAALAQTQQRQLDAQHTELEALKAEVRALKSRN